MATVAVASTDGIHIDLHFGAANRFLLYEVHENGEFKLIERREFLQIKIRIIFVNRLQSEWNFLTMLMQFWLNR
jgi:Dinitrogenase iron-molybdenum cofactor.